MTAAVLAVALIGAVVVAVVAVVMWRARSGRHEVAGQCQCRVFKYIHVCVITKKASYTLYIYPPKIVAEMDGI